MDECLHCNPVATFPHRRSPGKLSHMAGTRHAIGYPTVRGGSNPPRASHASVRFDVAPRSRDRHFRFVVAPEATAVHGQPCRPGCRRDADGKAYDYGLDAIPRHCKVPRMQVRRRAVLDEWAKVMSVCSKISLGGSKRPLSLHMLDNNSSWAVRPDRMDRHRTGDDVEALVAELEQPVRTRASSAPPAVPHRLSRATTISSCEEFEHMLDQLDEPNQLDDLDVQVAPDSSCCLRAIQSFCLRAIFILPSGHPA